MDFFTIHVQIKGVRTAFRNHSQWLMSVDEKRSFSHVLVWGFDQEKEHRKFQVSDN